MPALSAFAADDPLSLVLRPPSDETPEERQARIRDEQIAKRVSEDIDAQIKRDKEALLADRKRKAVRVLLLGQSESGKSTLLKNFQLVWATQAWKEERASWRSVIHLNIINSVFKMLTVLLNPDHPSVIDPASLEALFAELSAAQAALKRRLGAGSYEPGDYRTGSFSYDAPPQNAANASGAAPREFFVRSDASWKDRLFSSSSASARKRRPSNADYRPSTESDGADEVRDMLMARKEDIQFLWHHQDVRAALHRAAVWMEETPGFFMNDLDRILTRGYLPSDDDVVRARLRTMGIQEHRFLFETGMESGREWRIYDVGGSRPQRSSWFSYFDDANAVIFLVPLNVFDEVLEEDQRVSRLQDSIDLWKAICRSPLLANAQLILFFNKIDLLERKLKAGIRFTKFVPTYGDRPNKREAVCRYLRTQFKDIQNRYSPTDRPFNSWYTNATDTKATEKTLGTVRHGIVTNNFAKANLV